MAIAIQTREIVNGMGTQAGRQGILSTLRSGPTHPPCDRAAADTPLATIDAVIVVALFGDGGYRRRRDEAHPHRCGLAGEFNRVQRAFDRHKLTLCCLPRNCHQSGASPA